MSDNVLTFEEQLNKNGSLIFTNVGFSMLPMLREGKDIIHVKRYCGGGLKKYDVVLFVRPQVSGRGHYVLHRILKENSDGSYWIVGDNNTAGENVSPECIIGVLDSFVHNGKNIKVSSLTYRLYVLFWCAHYHLRFFVLRFSGRVKRFYKRRIRRLKGNK